MYHDVRFIYMCTEKGNDNHTPPLKLWVRIPHMGRCTRYNICDQVYQWLAVGRWFSPGTLVSSTSKTDRHDITEILLKVALNIIPPTIIHKSIYITQIYFIPPLFGVPFHRRHSSFLLVEILLKSIEAIIFWLRLIRPFLLDHWHLYLYPRSEAQW